MEIPRRWDTITSMKVLAALASATLALSGPLNGPVEFYDEDDLVPYNQEWVITQLSYDITFPEEVKRLAYVVFMENESDLSRSISTTYPAELLSEDGKQFADGTLIIAIGLNPKSKGIYCAPDVCEALGLNDSSHLNGARAAMDVHTSHNRYDRALLDAARAAADPETANNYIPFWLKFAIGWFAAICILAALWGATRLVRNRQHSTAADIRWLTKNAPSISLGFKQVDIQVDALTSPLATPKLHQQWDSIAHEMKQISTLTPSLPSGKEYAEEADHDAVEQSVPVMRNNVEGFQTACANIEYLYALENGDPHVRELELKWLARDMRHTRSAIHEDGISSLIERTQAVSPEDPAFIETLCKLYDEYMPFTEKLMSLKKLEKRRVPSVWDFNWHPCYAYCELQTFESLH